MSQRYLFFLALEECRKYTTFNEARVSLLSLATNGWNVRYCSCTMLFGSWTSLTALCMNHDLFLLIHWDDW